MGVRIFRNLTGMMFWGFVVLPLTLVVNFIVVLSNYMGCRSAFELQNYERIELFRDEMVGRFLGHFFTEATQTHLYALTVAVVLALSLFLFFHFGFKILPLINERKTYISQGDQESAALARQHLYQILVYMAVLIIPLIWALYYDALLFRYRSVAGALGIEDPAAATQKISSWTGQLQEKSHLMAWELTRFGVWGYLSLTILACYGLEHALSKIMDYGLSLVNNFQELIKPSHSSEEAIHYGYDAQGNPVFDPHTPLAYDPDGKPLESSGKTEGHPEFGPPQNNTQGFEDATQMQANKTGEYFKEEYREENVTASASGKNPLEDDNKTTGSRKEVVGKPGEWLTLAEALADKKRYWVDPDNHEIWAKEYRENLLREHKPSDKAA